MIKRNKFKSLLLASALFGSCVGCAASDVAGVTTGDETAAPQDETTQDQSNPDETTNPESETSEVESWRPEGWTEQSHAKGVDADYERIFPNNDVQKIEITISAQQYESMLENMIELYGEAGQGSGGGPGPGGGGGGGGFSDEEPLFVPVNVEYNGLTWWNVGMRFKGNSTLSGSWRRGGKKLPFRLDFDEFEDTYEEIDDQRFYGFKKITFSSGANDDSLIREKLGGELFRDAGVKVARSSFYQIYLDVGDGNGKVYAGLYTMVEDLSDDFLKSQFEDDNGNLYKPDGSGADWQSFVEEGFVKKSNEEEADWTDIQNAIEALHAPQNDAESWRAELERHFNVGQYLKLLAVNQSIENWDTYGLMTHNYYLYANPSDNGRLLWLPWDLNECLQPSRGNAMSVLLDEVSDRWPVIRYLMDDPVYAAQYYEELASFLDGAFAIDKVHNRMDELHQLVTPYVIGEHGEVSPYTNLNNASAFETSLTEGSYALKPHVEDRHEAVEDALSLIGFE
jgi:hypothetical protein